MPLEIEYLGYFYLPILFIHLNNNTSLLPGTPYMLVYNIIIINNIIFYTLGLHTFYFHSLTNI